MPLVETDTGQPSGLLLQPIARARYLVSGGPRLSQSAGELLRRLQIVDEYGDHRLVEAPVERPLSIRLDGQIVATLWTLGASAEWLVMGYLWTRQLVTDVTAIESISISWAKGVAEVVTRGGAIAAHRPGVAPWLDFAGQIGTDAGGTLLIGDELRLSPLPAKRMARTTLLSILQHPLKNDAIYRAAGSVHGCALFSDAELWISVEDVSRRNALDTICGWMALHGIPGTDMILYTTGRLTAEVIMKAALSGISTVISRKGMTALCYDLAERLGMNLFGHASKGRYISYAGAERFDAHC
ncbi:MAG TPA: formate dehydrogenase accessory sulfurtransferase FdhD [Steroidobacteraceae bacterium]|jgi:FdhD protein|nr:formate dehydrogenase accessory sulfurtransferase FdhD [Steroidobacteraceae bacterium]